MTMNSVFEQVASGVLPARIVHASDEFVAFHDADPRADVHVLVVPRTAHADLDAWLAAGGDGDALLGFIAEVVQLLDVAGRYRLITDVGPGAGQVVRHLHWHIMSGAHLPGFA
jgi:histidine triad (HIT) family protein